MTLHDDAHHDDCFRVLLLTFSVFLNIPVEIGSYNISISATTNDNSWCSCPTIGNGFILSHELWSWVTVDHNKLTLSDNSRSHDTIMINRQITDNVEYNDTYKIPFIIKDQVNNNIPEKYYITSILSTLILIDKLV